MVQLPAAYRPPPFAFVLQFVKIALLFSVTVPANHAPPPPFEALLELAWHPRKLRPAELFRFASLAK